MKASEKITGKEVMLVAWSFCKWDKKATGEFNFAQNLKAAWDLAKNHIQQFLVELHDVILRRRKDTLKDIDFKSMFGGVPNGRHVTVKQNGKWWEEYEWLFKLDI